MESTWRIEQCIAWMIFFPIWFVVFVVYPSSLGMKTDPSFLLLFIEMSTTETINTQHGERTGCMRIPYVSENKGIALLIVNCIFPGILLHPIRHRARNNDRSVLWKGLRQLRRSHLPSRSPSVFNGLFDCGMDLEHRMGSWNLSVIEAEGSDSQCWFANSEYGELMSVRFVKWLNHPSTSFDNAVMSHMISVILLRMESSLLCYSRSNPNIPQIQKGASCKQTEFRLIHLHAILWVWVRAIVVLEKFSIAKRNKDSYAVDQRSWESGILFSLWMKFQYILEIESDWEYESSFG